MTGQTVLRESAGADRSACEAAHFSRRERSFVKTFTCFFLCICFCPHIVFAAEPPSFKTLTTEYEREVQPLLRRFCLECHSSEKKIGELDLQQFATLAEVRRGTRVWLKVAEMLGNGEMPPEDSKQPSPEQRKKLRGWVKRYLDAEALASAGDPGPVVLRRLTNAEYTYTIRDLTGVPLNPAREFPTEGAAGEGFTNAGNALVMSPGLLRKYLDAGKEIASHAVLLSDGFRFSPHTTSRDWTDEILADIRAFYRQHAAIRKLGTPYKGYEKLAHLGNAGVLPLEEYLAATLAERELLGTGDEAIAAVAAKRGLNATYLRLLWSRLTADDDSLLLQDLRSRWRTAKPEDAVKLASHVAAWHKGLWTFNPIGLLGRKGSRSRWLEPISPLLAQQELRVTIAAPNKDQKEKAIIVSLVATDAGDGNEHDFVVWQNPRLVAKGKPDILLRDVKAARLTRHRRRGNGPDDSSQDDNPVLFGKHPNGSAIEPASICVQAPAVIRVLLPAEVVGRELVTTAALDSKTGGEGSVQADLVAGTSDLRNGLRPGEVIVTLSRVNIGADKREVFYRHPILVAPKSKARQRIESALNDHRKLFPAALCYSQIVPVDEPLTLTLFYREDDHLRRLMLDDAQQTQLDRLWSELRYVSREPLRVVDVLDSLLETTTDHPQAGIFDDTVKSFNERANAFRKTLVASETKHVDALIPLAARAWRRPVSKTEEGKLRGLYRRLRELKLPHDEAFRLTLARVLVASPFLYRLEEASEGTEPARVSDVALATRLSYFIWSSMPDEMLRTAADRGKLHDPAELLRQTRRMLKDPRVRRLATEFACQWLHIHEFDPLEKKSEKQFPEFAELRGDMYEESIRFFTDLFQHDGSLLSLLNADHTFVNERLAKFYGVPEIDGDAWQRVDGIQQHGRGGILGMATTLAKQSGATRTSPILRGNWISEVLLGEKLPKPPKNVPQLADAVPEGLTERQLIERHSNDAACAKCHARIDPFGFALESFDAIGRRRDTNAGGLAIDSRTTLPDGSKIEGLSGLRNYLLEKRRNDFLSQLCRKLVGYALGRELQLSDRPLIDEILTRLEKNDYRFSVAVETIVLSDQFRKIRARSFER